MIEISVDIQNQIKSIRNSEKAKWLENYIKHDVKSLGVGIPDIRKIVIKKNNEYKISDKPISKQIEFLNDFMNKEYTEYKLVAILYIQLFWENRNDNKKIDIISSWFDFDLITDWNVCDWLCVRILSPMVDNWYLGTMQELKKWNKDKNLWKARASLVPLAQCKTIKNQTAFILDFSIELIRRDERFCKTAVGWVLREYSKIDSEFVKKFLSDYESWTSPEVVKNATKYLNRKAK